MPTRWYREKQTCVTGTNHSTRVVSVLLYDQRVTSKLTFKIQIKRHCYLWPFFFFHPDQAPYSSGYHPICALVQVLKYSATLRTPTSYYSDLHFSVQGVRSHRKPFGCVNVMLLPLLPPIARSQLYHTWWISNVQSNMASLTRTRQNLVFFFYKSAILLSHSLFQLIKSRW